MLNDYEKWFLRAYISILLIFVGIIPAFIYFWTLDNSSESILNESIDEITKFGGMFVGILIIFLLLQWQYKSSKASVLAVTGTIYDDKGNILEGAEIFIDGNSRSTKSNRNGHFSLEINPNLPELYLNISYDGYSEAKTVSKHEMKKPIYIKLKKKHQWFSSLPMILSFTSI